MAKKVKNSPAMRETWVQSLSWEDSPGGGRGNPLQYSCLENPPWTEEPDGLQSMGLQRVGHDSTIKHRVKGCLNEDLEIKERPPERLRNISPGTICLQSKGNNPEGPLPPQRELVHFRLRSFSFPLQGGIWAAGPAVLHEL